MASWTREQTFDFIQLYRSNECLWKLNSRDYNNRELKDRAYSDIVEFSRSIDPQFSSRDHVIKKINNLRSSFRKEFKKVESSKISGTCANDIYVPKLWYFEELLFLRDQDIPRSAVSSMICQSQASVTTSHDLPLKFEDSIANYDFDTESIDLESPLSPSSITRPGSTLDVPLHQPVQEVKNGMKKRKSSEELLAIIACNALSKISKTDGHDIFGQHVASVLKEMSSQQQIYAEKIISEVLFEGRLNNLSRATRIDGGVNPDEVQQGTSANSNYSQLQQTGASNSGTYPNHLKPKPSEEL